MMNEKIPRDNIRKYFDYLINKTYKILPLKEEGVDTLNSYLESFLNELLGNQKLITFLGQEPKYMTFLNTIEYLATEDYSIAVCKKEVFKCIHILKDINKKYFQSGDLHG